MVKVNCLNPIAKIGMRLLPDTFGTTDNLNEADAVLVILLIYNSEHPE